MDDKDNHERYSEYSDDFEEDAAKPESEGERGRGGEREEEEEKEKRAVGKGKEKAKSPPPSNRNVPVKSKGWKAGAKQQTLSDSNRLSTKSKPTPYHQGRSPFGRSRDRVLSAKQRALAVKQNELAEVKRELEALRRENKFLNRLQARNERDLTKYQTQEGELPQILSRHTEEVRALKEQLRRCQEASDNQQRRMNDMRQELLRVGDRKRKLEEVVKRRRLLEREELTVQLQMAQGNLEERNRQINDLKRGMEVMRKTHGQEMRSLQQRNKALVVETEQLQTAADRAHLHLKEKKKEVDIMNIYSHRITRPPPHPLPHPQQPPVKSCQSQTDLTCPPFKSVSMQTRPQARTAASQTDLSVLRSEHPPKRLQTNSTQTETERAVTMAPGSQEATPTRTRGDVSTRVSLKHSPLAEQSSPRGTAAASLHMTDNAPRSLQLKLGVEPTARHSPDREKLQGRGGGGGGGGGVSTVATLSQEDKSEERQKKDLLLARLRALDGQKAPPASHTVMPSTSSNALKRSSAEPTTSVPVATELHAGTGAPPTFTAQGKKKEGVVATGGVGDDEAQRKKKLLLAKLMAIDEGEDPANSNPSKSKKSQSGASGPSSAHSRSSTQSWPEKIENLHHGRPVLATEGDPFGSQHSFTSSSSRKRGTEVDQRTRGEPAMLSAGKKEKEAPQLQRRGGRRRVPTPVPKNDLFSSDGRSLEATNGEYLPSFGRRTTNTKDADTAGGRHSVFGELSFGTETNKTGEPEPARDTLTTISPGDTDYPWENRISISPGNPPPAQSRRGRGGAESVARDAKVFGSLKETSGTSTVAKDLRNPGANSLLPLRPKAEPMRGAEMMPGAIADPEDLEELAL